MADNDDSSVQVTEKTELPEKKRTEGIMENRMKKYKFVKDGRPYDPTRGPIEFQLPSSIYSSVWVILLARMPLSGITMIWLSGELPQIICYIACLVLQWLFIRFIGDLAGEHGDCRLNSVEAGEDVGQFLRLLCLIVFVAFVIADILETLGMYAWMYYIPIWDDKDQGAIDKAIFENGGFECNLFFQKYKQERVGLEDIELIKPAFGNTMGFHIMTYAILSPKLVFAILLMYYGSGHLLGAGDAESLILNTVASIFVFEVDDIAYGLLISPIHKLWVQETSTIHMIEEELPRCARWSFYVIFPILIACWIGMYYIWCGSLE